MRRIFKVISQAALLGGAGIAFASAAHAEAEAEAGPGGNQIEDIVVTAQRASEKSQNVPVALTAFSQASIENQSIANIADVQFHAPNVVIRDEPALGGLTIGIRGISVSATNFSLDSAVGVYVNDVFIARANDFGATFYDVAGVQILRGPQGTLFGRNTPVGAVLVDTVRPGDSYGGYVLGTVGGGGHRIGSGADRTLYRFEGAVDLPVSPILGVRLAGFYVNDSGWGRSRVTGYENSSRDNNAIRGTFKFTPSSDFDATLILDRSRSKEGGALFVPLEYVGGTAGHPYDLVNGGKAAQNALIALANTTPRDPYFNDSGFTNQLNTSRATSATLQMNYQISDDWSVRSISAWRHTNRRTISDFTGIPFTGGSTGSTLRQTQISQELIIKGDVGEKLHLLAGGYYSRETGQNTNTLSVNATPYMGFYFFDPLYFSANDIKYSSKSLFGNVAYDVFSNLTASFGFRYGWENKFLVIDNKLLVSGFPLFRGPQSFRDKVPLYDAKITWKATPDLLLYAKYGTGYRAGGIGFQTTANSPFLPEKAKTYEAGFKWDLKAGSVPVRLNAAVFDTVYRNFQVPVSLNNPTRSTYTNAGQATIRGAEFELMVKPTQALDLSASLGLLDAGYDEFQFSPKGVTLDLKDNRLRDAPKVVFTASAGYTVPSSIGEWLFQVDYAYRSSYETDTVLQRGAPGLAQTNVFFQGSTDAVNARIKLAEAFGSKVDISIWGKNLTDEKRLVNAFDTGSFRSGIYSEPLSYGIDLRAAF